MMHSTIIIAVNPNLLEAISKQSLNYIRMLDPLLLMDSFLFVINVIHVLIFMVELAPVDFPLKRSLMDFHYKFLPKDFATTNSIIPVVNTVLLGGCVCFAMQWFDSGAIEYGIRLIIAGYTLTIALILQKASQRILAVGSDRMMEIEQEIETADMLRWEPPSKSFVKTLMGAQNMIMPPEWIGLSNIPKAQPALYVMNHSLYGCEMPSFVTGLHDQTGVWVRGLADHFHFASPHGKFLKAFGAVDGTRANVASLMEGGKDILVFPGGAQEVMKHSSVPKYSLMWKERLGFARMAIKHGYPIIPCASIGVEDMLDILADINVTNIRKDQFIPVAKLAPHRLQKIYFWVGESIPTSQFNGDWKNDDFARQVRDAAKASIENGIKSLLKRQSTDPDRFLINQVINPFKNILHGGSEYHQYVEESKED